MCKPHEDFHIDIQDPLVRRSAVLMWHVRWNRHPIASLNFVRLTTANGLTVEFTRHYDRFSVRTDLRTKDTIFNLATNRNFSHATKKYSQIRYGFVLVCVCVMAHYT